MKTRVVFRFLLPAAFMLAEKFAPKAHPPPAELSSLHVVCRKKHLSILAAKGTA